LSPTDVESLFAQVDAVEGRTEDPLSRFVALDKERREIESRLEAIKSEQKLLEQTILNDWSEKGQQNARIAGLTVYVATDFWCSKKTMFSTPQVCERMVAVGLARLVAPAYSPQSLKAWVKEQKTTDEQGNEVYAIPEELAEVIQYGEEFRLRTRKA